MGSSFSANLSGNMREPNTEIVSELDASGVHSEKPSSKSSRRRLSSGMEPRSKSTFHLCSDKRYLEQVLEPIRDLKSDHEDKSGGPSRPDTERSKREADHSISGSFDSSSSESYSMDRKDTDAARKSRKSRKLDRSQVSIRVKHANANNDVNEE